MARRPSSPTAGGSAATWRLPAGWVPPRGGLAQGSRRIPKHVIAEMPRVSSSLALLLAPLALAEPMALNSKNFAKHIGGAKAAFVKFYAPWCGHCKAMRPDWEELSEEYDGNEKVTRVRPRAATSDARSTRVCRTPSASHACLARLAQVLIGMVDCTADDAQELCETHGVEGFPTLKSFDAHDDEGEEYDGERELEALREHAKALSSGGCHVDTIDQCTAEQKEVRCCRGVSLAPRMGIPPHKPCRTTTTTSPQQQALAPYLEKSADELRKIIDEARAEIKAAEDAHDELTQSLQARCSSKMRRNKVAR